MLTLHDYLESGNGYKARLLMSLLGIRFKLVLHDIVKGETRTPEYLAINPNGKIPVLVLEDGTPLAESNAILHYLAEGTPYLPDDRLTHAQAISWMCFEQYSHEPNIATVRFWMHLPKLNEVQKAQIAGKQEAGFKALGVMEGHPAGGRPWFVGAGPSIADIALYAYTHVADEGGFNLKPYPNVRGWLGRMAALPGYVPITKSDF